jgi:ATP-dependent Clp protease adaptor protein ClpS
MKTLAHAGVFDFEEGSAGESGFPRAENPANTPAIEKPRLGEAFHFEIAQQKRGLPGGQPAGVRDNPIMSVPTTAPAEVELEEPVGENEVEQDRPWIVIVWNDPINLMSYVTLVFQKLFGYSEAKATQLMLQVHNEGRAVVSGGAREKAEYDVARLHAHGLWATMRQD